MSFLDRVSPYLLLVLTTLFWAGNINLGRVIAGEIPPLGLAFWRWTVAFVVLSPFAYRPMRQQWPLVRQHLRLVLILSALGVAIFNSFVYIALQTTTATNGVLMQSISPVLIILLSTVFFDDKASPKQWVGVLVSLIGAAVVLVRGNISILFTLDFNGGDLWVLCAVICWSVYTVLLRKLPQALKGMPFLGYSILFGVLFISPFYLTETMNGRPVSLSLITVAGVAYVSVFASLLAFLFWNNAASRLGANRAGQFIHLIPVFGLTIATLILGERLQSYHYLGMCLVASGLLLANTNIGSTRMTKL
ncbi:MAG: EamA family transporter [Proteobacteria bacterium]|nr:MAG: EamA family transporter [Pseudomonadota bacterium]